MKIWTYGEAKREVIRDLDLEDEVFISEDELAGHFNKGITEAKSEIQALNQDYFLTKYYVPLVAGTKQYDLPDNIIANKIRGLFFINGSLHYEVSQFRRKDKFANIVMTDNYAPSADYSYLLVNDNGGQSKLEIHPAPRETAILPSTFIPLILFFIRDCARIPMIGEYCNPELIYPSQVSAVANTIQTYAGTSTIGIPQQFVAGGFPGSIAYITGDAVKFKAGPGGTVPGGLTAGTVYYVIAGAAGSIRLATTRLNALAGTAIDITTTGTICFTMTVAATTAIRDATILDIPEFTTFIMQWVKCCCMSKEGDPRWEAEAKILMANKQQMIDTLSEGIQDDDNEIQGDFSYYNELS